MKILIVAATSFEIAPLVRYLETHFTKYDDFQYQKGQLGVSVLIAGVGMSQTAYSLTKALCTTTYHLAINAGIAGAFRRKLEIGDVVQVVSEQFGDLGTEEADGSFSSVHEMGLIEPNQPPFKNGVLENAESSPYEFLPKCKGLTTNKVHGFLPEINKIQEKFGADIETMEGAAFFYVCLMENTPFLEIRSISNFVEERNKENWNISIAIENLNKVLIEIIKAMESWG